MSLQPLFWRSQEPPYLAEILFFAGKLQYFEADPETQKLQLILEESYEEAKQRSQESDAEQPI